MNVWKRIDLYWINLTIKWQLKLKNFTVLFETQKKYGNHKLHQRASYDFPFATNVKGCSRRAHAQLASVAIFLDVKIETEIWRKTEIKKSKLDRGKKNKF